MAGTEPAGNMATGRSAHVAIGLADGRALVAGGFQPSSANATATSELFDPATASFSTTGSMATARANAAAARLADGRVLVVGGTPINQSPPADVATAEIYDPVAATWSPTAGAMASPRTFAAAVALQSGLVLVIGGDATAKACEIYDPATGLFTSTGALATARQRFVASALPDGRVLVAGGQPITGSTYYSSTEIWDPATGLWSPGASMASARSNATATLLGSGKVLIAGGTTTSDTRSAVPAAELYDPVAGTFTTTGSLTHPRSRHTAALMGDGNVIAAGGLSGINSSPTATLDLYDVASGTWRSAGAMMQARQTHASTAVGGGDILIAGGTTPSNTAEVVDVTCVATLPAISPASASYPMEGGAGSVAVTHTPGCAWRVIGTFDWISFTTPVSGVGSGNVGYAVAANNNTFGRGQSFSIADNTFNVNQAANPCANASVSPAAQSFSYQGGSNSASLSVTSTCSWTVTGTPSWITIQAGGTGSAGIPYSVASNPTAASRSATVSIANRNLTVSQSANPCVPAPTISPSSLAFGVNSATSTVAVTAPFSCPWAVVGRPSWITMSEAGTGNTTLSLTAAANTGPARSATFTIAGNSITVTQAANVCGDATLSPATVALPNGSGTGSITLTAQAACSWTVTGTPSWMSITSGTSGSGSGTINYSFTANSAGARSATLTIAAKSFAVSQAAAVCFPAPTISPTSLAFSATAGVTGTGSVTVTAPAGCPWTVSSLPAWIALTTPSSGTGNGVVTYAVSANVNAASRSATLVIANVNHAVSQSAPGTATLPTGRLALARRSHTSTPLPDGRVLIAGGYLASGTDSLTASVEIYDPATGSFSAGPPMVRTRGEHAAVRLLDGRVLVIGGISYLAGATSWPTSAEIYDPATGSWAPTASMTYSRRTPLAVALPDGRVLVDGTTDLFPSEIFDPATGTFTTTGTRSVARLNPGITALADGRVLVLGGMNSNGTVYYASGEMWDPVSGLWAATASMSSVRAYGPTANVLPGGKVLVTGGYGVNNSVAASELFDPSTGAFALTGSLVLPRDSHQAATLPDGSVVVFGGASGNNTVERYNAAAGTWQTVGQFSDTRNYNPSALGGDGKVLVEGGFPGPNSSAEVFDPSVCPSPATLASTSQSFGSAGGSGSVSVTLTPGCPRNVSSDRPLWISVTSGGTGTTGSGTLTYSVSANTATTARTATFAIAGSSYTVAQAGATPPPPPPPATSYCASRGSTSSYEWIQQVNIAGQARVTGNNGGYADFTTSTAAIPLARGSNAISVTAGGGYSETWRIWIDFNNDLVFSADELVFSGAASGTIASTFTVPSTVSAGTRRMRISMSYGSAAPACGTFTYGEVEDYSVSIP